MEGMNVLVKKTKEEVSLETEEIDKDNLIDVIAGIPLDRNKPKSAQVTALFTGAGIKIDPNL